MEKEKKRRLHKNIVLAYHRLRASGGILCRQSSMDDEAQKRGGGYLYFAMKNNRPITPSSARFLIEKEIVKPIADGLFEGVSQSFEAVSIDQFNNFKELYEKV